MAEEVIMAATVVEVRSIVIFVFARLIVFYFQAEIVAEIIVEVVAVVENIEAAVVVPAMGRAETIVLIHTKRKYSDP